MEEAKDKVSIIMGIYNCEKLLPRAIESILQQTYSDWELIMCDDGSTDATYKVAVKYRESNPDKIIVLKNERNLRLAATLNRCFGVATGNYIARMDADDFSMPQRLEKQVNFLRQHREYDVVGCAAKISDGKKMRGTRVCKTEPTEDDVLLGPPFIHPTIMMRRKAFETIGGYTVAARTMRGQDWDLWFRFYAAGFQGYNLEEPLLIYHESENDYKKRTFKAAVGCTKTAIKGYKTLKVRPIKYIYIMKPIVSWFIPEKIKQYRRREI